MAGTRAETPPIPPVGPRVQGGRQEAGSPAKLPQHLSTGASRGQYHTLQSGFSSRSQGLSGDSTSVSDTRSSLESLGSAVTWRLWGRVQSPGSGGAWPPLTAIPILPTDLPAHRQARLQPGCLVLPLGRGPELQSEAELCP